MGKKKKSFYAKLKRQEDDKMAELAAKYRDRAAERRDGVPDKPENSRDGEDTESAEQKNPSHTSQTGGGYRAVAPDIQSTHDQTERRRQMIQESKFLGGDMEHTHLVKGLDFALLQKVRSEIASREKVSIDEDVLENIEATSKQNKGISDKISKYKDEELDLKTKKEVKEVKSEESEDQVVCRTTMAKILYGQYLKQTCLSAMSYFSQDVWHIPWILMKSMSHRMIQTPRIHILTYQQLP